MPDDIARNAAEANCILVGALMRRRVWLGQVGAQPIINLDPAQEEPYRIFKHDKPEYEKRVKAQAALLRG